MNLPDIIDALESCPPVLQRLVSGLTDEQMRAGHDADNWSIKEVLLHMRDTEEVMLERYTRLATEENPFLPAYDQEAFARDRAYQDADATQALTGFTALRRRSLDLFRRLDEPDLQRPGVHEERGAVTLQETVEHIVSHDLSHLAQIASALNDA